MNNHTFALSFFILCFFLCSCSGSRVALEMDDLKYPVSLSPYLYGPSHEVLSGNDLTSVGSFTYQKTLWGIFYSFVPLDGTADVAQAINREIEEKSGEGLVKFGITAEPCLINNWPFINWLPFWPGCTDVSFTGDIVKRTTDANLSQL